MNDWAAKNLCQTVHRQRTSTKHGAWHVLSSRLAYKVTKLDLVVQIHKNEIRLFEPCLSKSAIYVHVSCVVAESTSEPSPAEVCDESNSVEERPKRKL